MNNQQIPNRAYFIHILIFADNLKNMHDNLKCFLISKCMVWHLYISVLMYSLLTFPTLDRWPELEYNMTILDFLALDGTWKKYISFCFIAIQITRFFMMKFSTVHTLTFLDCFDTGWGEIWWWKYRKCVWL
jgi:hypothetical protein